MNKLSSLLSPIQFDHYQLRIIEKKDSSKLYHLINNWNVVKMLSDIPFPYPQNLLDQWIDKIIIEATEGKSFHFSIVHSFNEHQSITGCIGLRINKQDKSGVIGYWIGQEFWGNQLATKAVKALSTSAFTHLDLSYIHATPALDNPASIAVLKKNGFQPFGNGKEKFLARNNELSVAYFLLQREHICPNVKTSSSFISKTPSKKLLLVVAAALIDIKGKLLLAKRPEGKSMAGMWEFPGGKVELGETPETALIRELKEELDIDVSQSCLAPFTFASYDYPEFHLLMPLYLCHRWKNYPIPKEGQQLDWVGADQLKDYLVMEADQPFIPLLKDLLI